MKKILIDTNIYSHAMRGDPDVTDQLAKMDEIGICVISIGELYSGFKAGSRELENHSELEFFLDSPRVVLYPVDITHMAETPATTKNESPLIPARWRDFHIKKE